MMKKVMFLTVLALFVLLTTVPLADGALAQEEDQLTLSISDETVNENDYAIFVVKLSSYHSSEVTVDYYTADGTAKAGSDYIAESGTLTFPKNWTQREIYVRTSDDYLIEGRETFYVNLTNPTNATISDSQGIGTIVDTDRPELSISDVTVNEGDFCARFTVSLSSPTLSTVKVDYNTSDGTATAGSDYVAESGTLAFGAYMTTREIPIKIKDDFLIEGRETFYVNLTNPTNADIWDNQGIGTIVDNDPPRISIKDVKVNEGDGNALFVVSLSSPFSGVTVDYYTADGTAKADSDYVAKSGTLTFPTNSKTKVISVPINDDEISEDIETFYLKLENPTNATISDSQGIGTIVSDDEDPARLEENGHYYEVIYTPWIGWYNAAHIADMSSFHGARGHLATIHSSQEQLLINNLRLDVLGYETSPHYDEFINPCWIGLFRGMANNWEWITGEPMEGFWFFWGNEGTHTNEHFVMMATWEYDIWGYWGSWGNGLMVYADAYAVEYPDPPPTADAGQDQSVTDGTLVTLDGGNSTDPDDDYPLTFSWEISSAPNGSTVALDEPSSVTPSFTPEVTGTYVITLVVDDSYGVSSDPDQVIVEAFSPELMLEALSDEVDATDLPEATKTSLNASLDTAMKVLEDSNPKNDVAAINALEAFINKIEAQRGKKIPEEVADELIAKAQDIIAVLSGET